MPGSRWAPWLVSEWEGPARQGELTPSDSDQCLVPGSGATADPPSQRWEGPPGKAQASGQSPCFATYLLCDLRQVTCTLAWDPEMM